MDVLDIECLPQYLPERIDVDISGLIEIGDSILVKDIPWPEGIQAMDDPDALIVVVSAPISEEELDMVDEVELEDVIEPEVIEKGLVEEDEE